MQPFLHLLFPGRIWKSSPMSYLNCCINNLNFTPGMITLTMCRQLLYRNCLIHKSLHKIIRYTGSGSIEVGKSMEDYSTDSGHAYCCLGIQSKNMWSCEVSYKRVYQHWLWRRHCSLYRTGSGKVLCWPNLTCVITCHLEWMASVLVDPHCRNNASWAWYCTCVAPLMTTLTAIDNPATKMSADSS